MKSPYIYGIALIVGSVGGLITMAFHPTGHDLLAQADEIVRRNETITVATHSLAIASVPILVFGFVGLGRKLGATTAVTEAAFIAYVFAGMAAVCAATINGLVGPQITRRMLEADAGTRQMLDVVFANNTLLNQAFSKIFAVAASTSIVLWATSIVKSGALSRSVGAVGLVVGVGSLMLLLSGHVRMNVHGFGFLILLQSLWIILVGILLCRYKPESDALS